MEHGNTHRRCGSAQCIIIGLSHSARPGRLDAWIMHGRIMGTHTCKWQASRVTSVARNFRGHRAPGAGQKACTAANLFSWSRDHLFSVNCRNMFHCLTCLTRCILSSTETRRRLPAAATASDAKKWVASASTSPDSNRTFAREEEGVDESGPTAFPLFARTRLGAA